MNNFQMSLTVDESPSNDFTAVFGPGSDLRGQTMTATLYQNWKNQHVFMVGAGYEVTDEFTARIGAKHCKQSDPR